MATKSALSYIAPAAPDHLSNRAKALWLELVPAKVASPARLALLQVALENLDLIDQVRGVITSEGLTVTTTVSAVIHCHPLLRTLREAQQQVTRIFATLGLALEDPRW